MLGAFQPPPEAGLEPTHNVCPTHPSPTPRNVLGPSGLTEQDYADNVRVNPYAYHHDCPSSETIDELTV